jgi:hypothetical protein
MAVLTLSGGCSIMLFSRLDLFGDFCVFFGLHPRCPGYRCPVHSLIVLADDADNLRSSSIPDIDEERPSNHPMPETLFAVLGGNLQKKLLLTFGILIR